MTITRNKDAIIQKMKGRMIKDIYTQDISGGIFQIIIEFHDGYKVELSSQYDGNTSLDWINIDEVGEQWD